MTDLHKAAQQVLEAWQTATYGHPSHHKATLLAMTALSAALAQQAEPKGGGNLPPPLQAEPVQEPVAWLVMDESGYVQHAASWRDAAHEHINDAINEHDLVCARTWRVVPVYTAPPQRKPLTEEEIDVATAQERDALLDHIYEYGTAAEGVLERIRKLCRAVERAHGIGEQP